MGSFANRKKLPISSKGPQRDFSKNESNSENPLEFFSKYMLLSFDYKYCYA